MSKSIRIQFTKGSEVRFLSHLDLTRAIERAARRARLPLALSEGFSPRPLIGYGFALPVGVASKAEYADIRLMEEWDPMNFLEHFNRFLPPGVQILAADYLPDGSPALMAEVNSALWKVEIPRASKEDLEEKWQRFRGADSFEVERQTKQGTRLVDIRPLVFGLPRLEQVDQGVEVHCLAAVGNQGNLKMEELGFVLGFNPLEAIVTRVGQYKKEGSYYHPPLGNRGFTWTE